MFFREQLFFRDQLKLYIFLTLDLEVKSLVTAWGEGEYRNYKKDMDQIIKHDNGLYLSSRRLI